MKAAYKINTESKAHEKNTFCFDKIRITLLTPSLVRLEWSEKNLFTDEPSQKVWFRGFPDVLHQTSVENDTTYIQTEKLVIKIQQKACLHDSVKISLKDGIAPVIPSISMPNFWRYGDKYSTLKGTARTLDNADGEIELEEGILSRTGFSILDDSKSYLINQDGELCPRKDSDAVDVYFFGYEKEYKKCLKDYLTLTGLPPLLPRYALGNWWSRYHKYTQKEYIELIERFEKENIPLAVAMIDMDWHLTQIDKTIGTGWTGYTWNKEYFPEPEEFLSCMHKHNLKVSLNVHPAEGVGRHEEAYESMKKALGLPVDGKTVPFDITDARFVEAYFECLHEPLEKQGIDFWWIDWQQGETTKLPGLDPLWVLNHYHFLDNAKSGQRSLILSRYAGPGSHRYPVGFSGDTIISWKSLAFQPYFTANASNIGYGWWSHDIGGHMLGSYNEELQIRWVQFGVFSPVMRLHSSASPFNHKEPWKFKADTSSIITKYMQLRHRMIPYLYTMNYRFSKNGEPLIQPMYYSNPEIREAYQVPNQYYFGSELICAPVTSPKQPKLNRSAVSVWLPEGRYTDVFTGITYEGGRKLTLYRSLNDTPVLLKSGGIVPLAALNELDNHKKLPECFDIYTAPGNGEFSLYEDDGESLSYMEGKSAVTKMSVEQGEDLTFTIKASEGGVKLLPEHRHYNLHVLNCNEIKSIQININGKKSELKSEKDYTYDYLRRETVVSFEAGTDEEVHVNVICSETEAESKIIERKKNRLFELLDKMEYEFLEKERIFFAIEKADFDALKVSQALLNLKIQPDIIEAVLELLANN